MKLVTFIHKNKQKIGHLSGDIDQCDYNSKGYVLDISASFDYIDMLDFIKRDGMNNSKIKEYIYSDKAIKYPLSEVTLTTPINPRSLRDAYAFRQHVETSRKNRGLEMIKEFDDFPVYYYSNIDGIVGPGDMKVDDIFMKNLDFELEVGVHGVSILGFMGEAPRLSTSERKQVVATTVEQAGGDDLERFLL